MKAAPLEEHLGKRKSEGQGAVAAGRGRAPELERLARAWGGALGQAASARVIGPIDGPQALVAAVEPLAGAAVRALLALAGAGVPRRPLRLCTSLAPDAVRAALAGTAPGGVALLVAQGDRPHAQAFEAQAIAQLPPPGPIASAFAPEALAIARAAGAPLDGLLAAAAAACEELLAAPPEENGALRLASLLSGLGARGAANVTLLAAPPLLPLARWLEALAARAPAPRLQLLVGEPAADPAAYGTDRLFVELRATGSPPDPRVRRLNAAGLPTLQIAAPSGDGLQPGLVAELVRWELALALAFGTAAAEGALPEPDPQLETPALRDGPLSLHAGGVHAHVLSKVAGTLGAKAAASAPHWLAAQLALHEPGDFAALHFSALPTQALREALPGLQAAVRDATKLATRAAPDLSGLAPDRAGGAAHGLFFLLSDGGGAELRRGALLLGARHRREELQRLAALVAADRRALLLRAEDGDPARLVAAVRDAAALLTR